MFFNTNKIPKKKIDLCFKKKSETLQKQREDERILFVPYPHSQSMVPLPRGWFQQGGGAPAGTSIHSSDSFITPLPESQHTCTASTSHAAPCRRCACLQQLPQTGPSNRYGNCCDGGDASQRWTCSLSLASASRRTKMYNWDLAGKRIVLRLDFGAPEP